MLSVITDNKHKSHGDIRVGGGNRFVRTADIVVLTSAGAVHALPGIPGSRGAVRALPGILASAGAVRAVHVLPGALTSAGTGHGAASAAVKAPLIVAFQFKNSFQFMWLLV